MEEVKEILEETKEDFPKESKDNQEEMHVKEDPSNLKKKKREE